MDGIMKIYQHITLKNDIAMEDVYGAALVFLNVVNQIFVSNIFLVETNVNELKYHINFS
jgi:hypothetical protein